MNTYQPALGGHAPGHLRSLFCEWIETGEVPTNDCTVPYQDQPNLLRWLIGQLWNCTDTVPGSECAMLDLPAGSTYAQAARNVRAR